MKQALQYGAYNWGAYSGANLLWHLTLGPYPLQVVKQGTVLTYTALLFSRGKASVTTDNKKNRSVFFPKHLLL
jgi:hypothetical protein